MAGRHRASPYALPTAGRRLVRTHRMEEGHKVRAITLLCLTFAFLPTSFVSIGHWQHIPREHTVLVALNQERLESVDTRQVPVYKSIGRYWS